MDQRLNLGTEVRELKLGSTFSTSNPRTSFHTLKYDFKPASVDLSKAATLDVSANNQVTVTMPHLESSGVPKTVFKGNQRNYTKECVLIIDKVTGEITLEKLHHNIQVKKTRSENTSKSGLLGQSSSTGSGIGGGGVASGQGTSLRPALENSTQRTVSKTKVSTGVRKPALSGFVPRHSPIQGSPSYPHHRSPQQAPAWNANNGQSTLPSIPLIGMDDDYMPSTTTSSSVNDAHHSQQHSHHSQSSSNFNQTTQLSSSPSINNSSSHQQHPSSSSNHSNSTHSSLNNNHSGYSSHQQYQQQPTHHSSSNHHQQSVPQIHVQHSDDVGLLSSSGESSDSSESDSGSGSDSDDDGSDKDKPQVKSSNANNHHINGGGLPALLLDEDLRLSESNSSDSDD